MEKVLKILGWIALLTLTFAIAKQLAEQRQIMYLLPDAWGKPYHRYGFDGGDRFFSGREGFRNGPADAAGAFVWSESIMPMPRNSGENTGGIGGFDEDDLATGPQGQPALSPADSQLENMREPYALLKGAIPVKTEEGDLTAVSCFRKDFLSATNKVGNYIQRTNNYKHATPDDCSAPLTEMVDSFYKNPELTLTRGR